MAYDYMTSFTSGFGSNNTISWYHFCSIQYHHHRRHFRPVKKYNGNNLEMNDYYFTRTIQSPLPLPLQQSSLSHRGGSNSIVLQYYCKVLQYFGFATPQIIAISITKSQSIAILIANFSSIAKSIAKLSSIAKSIANFFKYCKKYWKKSSIAKSIEKYEYIAKRIAKFKSVAKIISKFRVVEKNISAMVLFTEFWLVIIIFTLYV